MKISFEAEFRKKNLTDFVFEEELNDVFLIFLPRKIEITTLKAPSYLGAFYALKMETDEVYSLKEMKERLENLGIYMERVRNVKREFREEELEKIKKMVCFEKIFKNQKSRKK